LNKHVITSVRPDSPAAELGIKPGDVLLAVNGRNVVDVFDYRSFIQNEHIELSVQKKSGEKIQCAIDKDEYEDAGLEFGSYLMDAEKRCVNKCVFCFIDQLPADMRPSLYIKDDDARLSFLSGNYVTLTNIGENALNRLISHRLSPINISVHATDPALRASMMNNGKAGDVLNKIRTIADARLSMNFQAVLCKSVNDGDALDKTIRDLAAFFPYGNSLSVVPAGLTAHRDGLYPIEPYNAEDAKRIINRVRAWQKKLLPQTGSRFVYAADEFYIKAGMNIPGHAAYEDFPQLENGVGMAALFKRGAGETLRKTHGGGEKIIDVVTGDAAYALISGTAAQISAKFPQITIFVHRVINDFFGAGVTVSGLLTGRDIIGQLSGKLRGKTLLLPRNALRAGTDLFLDGVRLGDISGALGAEATACDIDGRSFVRAVTDFHRKV